MTLEAMWLDCSIREQVGSGPFSATEENLTKAFFYAGAISVITKLDDGETRDAIFHEIAREAEKHKE